LLRHTAANSARAKLLHEWETLSVTWRRRARIDVEGVNRMARSTPIPPRYADSLGAAHDRDEGCSPSPNCSRQGQGRGVPALLAAIISDSRATT